MNRYKNWNCFTSILHLLGSLSDLISYYGSNQYVQMLDKDYSQNQIEYMVCFSDWAKNIWYSDYKQDSIDCKMLYNIVVKLANNKNKYKNIFSIINNNNNNNSNNNSFLTTFLHDILIPLHNTP